MICLFLNLSAHFRNTVQKRHKTVHKKQGVPIRHMLDSKAFAVSLLSARILLLSGAEDHTREERAMTPSPEIAALVFIVVMIGIYVDILFI